mgnify:CR=1 FL=1
MSALLWLIVPIALLALAYLILPDAGDPYTW